MGLYFVMQKYRNKYGFLRNSTKIPREFLKNIKKTSKSIFTNPQTAEVETACRAVNAAAVIRQPYSPTV